MDDNNARNQVLKCLAGIILNAELHRNGFINKLLIEMNEDEYKDYLKFLQTQINNIISE